MLREKANEWPLKTVYHGFFDQAFLRLCSIDDRIVRSPVRADITIRSSLVDSRWRHSNAATFAYGVLLAATGHMEHIDIDYAFAFDAPPLVGRPSVLQRSGT
jgi:hypothetical protein